MAFEYPSIYDFPPFFTPQPNQDTWAKQVDLWCDLLLSYCRSQHVFTLAANPQSVPFTNQKISRSLPKQTIVEVLDRLVKQSRAEWTTKEKSLCYIYWNTPEEWANLISKWIYETGKQNSVITLYEIVHGDEAIDQGTATDLTTEFHEADETVIRKALDLLSKKGKATLFSSSDGNTGIKFS
ncbi:Vacuolar protein-sorting-associated protein 25 [Kappamyces sp. JEL0680]|nr:Vacuolar protein-sorting-associated protein 25 [Kappamyces sp. JEL0680]